MVARRQRPERRQSEREDDERPLKKTTSALKALKDDLTGPPLSDPVGAQESEPVQAGDVHVHLGGRVPKSLSELADEGQIFQHCFQCMTCVDLDADRLRKATLQSVRLLKRRMDALDLIKRLFSLGGESQTQNDHLRCLWTRASGNLSPLWHGGRR